MFLTDFGTLSLVLFVSLFFCFVFQVFYLGRGCGAGGCGGGTGGAMQSSKSIQYTHHSVATCCKHSLAYLQLLHFLNKLLGKHEQQQSMQYTCISQHFFLKNLFSLPDTTETNISVYPDQIPSDQIPSDS